LIFKIIIVVLLFLIILSLSGGLFFLARDKGDTKRLLTSLTFRVVLSVSLFLLLIIGYLTDQLQPHGIYKPQPEQKSQRRG